MCLSPYRGWQIGLTSSGKPEYKITSCRVDYVYYDNGWRAGIAGSGNVGRLSRVVRDYIEIPCGQCLECRLNHSRMWADRMVLESMYHDESWFVTLTYDDDHLETVQRYYADPDTGEAQPVLSLNKRDLQLFLKRLRKNTGQKVRYYAAGEYGTKTHRPHYHLIIFGLHLPPDDLTLLSSNKYGEYYRSSIIEQCWPNGYVMASSVTWRTCAYVARYVTKKLNGGDRDFYTTFNLDPEFSLMSRRPGLGYQFFEEHMDEIYRHDEVIYATQDGSKTVAPPKYYDRLYSQIYPTEFAAIQQRRRENAADRKELIQTTTTLSMDEQLLARRRQLEARSKILKRPLD